MASSRSTNTMAEFLQRMLGDIAEAKTLPDADLEFLIALETNILQKLRAPIDALQGQMQAGGQQQGASPMPGDPAAMMGGVPGMVPGGQPIVDQSRVTGTRMEPNMPNPDELRRMLN